MIGNSDISNINKLLMEMNFGNMPSQNGGISPQIPVLVIQTPGAGVESTSSDDEYSDFDDENEDGECNCEETVRTAIADLQALLTELEAGSKGPEQVEKMKTIADSICAATDHMEHGSEEDDDPFSGLNSSDSDDEDDSNDPFGSDEDEDAEDEEHNGGFSPKKQDKPAPFSR